MTALVGFIIGLFVGAFIGIVLAALERAS